MAKDPSTAPLHLMFLYSRCVTQALEDYEARQRNTALPPIRPCKDDEDDITYMKADVVSLPDIYSHLPKPVKDRLGRRVTRIIKKEAELEERSIRPLSRASRITVRTNASKVRPPTRLPKLAIQQRPPKVQPLMEKRKLIPGGKLPAIMAKKRVK